RLTRVIARMLLQRELRPVALRQTEGELPPIICGMGECRRVSDTGGRGPFKERGGRLVVARAHSVLQDQGGPIGIPSRKRRLFCYKGADQAEPGTIPAVVEEDC